jgi:hypothetical protein
MRPYRRTPRAVLLASKRGRGSRVRLMRGFSGRTGTSGGAVKPVSYKKPVTPKGGK